MSPTTSASRSCKNIAAGSSTNKSAARSVTKSTQRRCALRKTSELRRRMQQDLQLAGLSERTHEAYLRAVRHWRRTSRRRRIRSASSNCAVGLILPGDRPERCYFDTS